MGEPIAASETACSRSGDGCRAMGSRSLRLLGGLAALIGLLPASIAQPSPNNQITARYLGAFDNAAAARSPGAGGSSLSSPQIGSLGGARPDLEQANPPASTASFNPAAVGLSAGSAQTLNLAFSVSGYGGSFTPTAVLHYGLSYTVGTLACTATDGSENCTVPVSFQPLYPGGRRDALFLMDGTTRLATVLLYGVGESPLALVQPASLVNTYNSTGSGNNSYFFQSVTDENGTVWSISSNANTLSSLTTAGVFTNIPYTGLYTSGLATIAMDGAGVIYISYANGSNSFVTYDTVQGTSGTFQLPGTERFEIVGVGNTGNVYAVDTNYENYYQMLGTIAPSGAVTLTPLALSSTGQPDSPEGIAVDSAENLFFGGYSTMNEYSNSFVQTTINIHNDKAGIAVDAADSLYAAAYGESSFVQLAPSNYTTPSYQFSGGEYGVSLGADGTVNAGEYFNLVQYNRSQGAISFATNYGDPTPAAQDTGIYNGGNQPLTISNIVLSGSPVFTVQQVATNSCTDGMVLAPGTACELAITFTSPHPGSFTGALAFTTNSLNAASSTQTVALSATTRGVYAVASPASLTFPDQIVNTTSAAQTVTVTNEGYPNNIGVGVPGGAAGGIFQAGVGTCGPGLAVGASCQFPVTFGPLSIQAYSGSFYLVTADNGGAGPELILPVSGTSIPTPTPLTINEVIHVSDGTPALVPATPLLINEVIHVSDGTPAAVPATPLQINEVLHISDGTSALVPATPLLINEVLHISDGIPAVVPATPLLINEVLHISDGTPAVVPATPLLINEVLHISDGTPAVVPATPLLINEVLHISDGAPAVVPATPLLINEVLHISDGTPGVVPATPLLINEVLHISDGTPAVVPATPLLINEVLHISDGTPAVVPATPLLINEVLHVSDTPGPIYPVVVAAVVETIHVTDTPTVGLPVVAAVFETIHVTDTPTVGLPVVAAVVETIHVTDTPAVGLPVVAAVVETIHVTDTPAVGLPVVAAVVETIHVTDTPAVGLPVVAAVVETIHVTDIPVANLTSPTTTQLNSSAAMMAAGYPVTFTATVSSAGGTPTGNVTFFDGTSALFAVSLSNGMATYTTSSLADGAHSISAVYSGNASFLASTSSTVAETITDFTLSFASSGGSGATLTILPGASGTYTITLTPPSNGYTGVITLSASGLPAGATATFSPNPIALGSTPVSSTLTITIPAAHAQIQPQWPINSKAFLLLGVLLPLLGLRRARKSRWLAIVLLSAGIAMGIGSCGGGFFTQAEKTYTVTIMAISGTDQHSATINLIVP
jgi:hypothetical protein